MPNKTNRLATIATRQRKSLVRDVCFAGLVAIAAIISITSVGTACNAATTHAAVHVAQR